MNAIEARQLLHHIHSVRTQALSGTGAPMAHSLNKAEGPSPGGFNHTLEHVLSMVNDHQVKAHDLAESFERGEDVSLSHMMIAGKKSELEFRALVEVRNRMVGAYQEVMNMNV